MEDWKIKISVLWLFASVAFLALLVVPNYMGDIRGSDFPARLMISFLSTVRRRVQAERGAWKERTRNAIAGIQE